MGKVVIIMVLGLSIGFGIISSSLSRSNMETLDTTTGYFKYSNARNIAHSAINLKLRKVDNGESPTASISGSVMGGTYLVDSIFFRNDSLGLRSTAQYLDTIYRVRTMFRRYPKPFPTVGAAVGLHVFGVGFNMSGSPFIDGNNHDINGNLISPSVPANNLPGVETMNKPDSITVAGYSSKIAGSPTKVGVNPGMANPADFGSEYIAMADYTYSPGTYGSNMTWGSVTNPVIVYANAGVDLVKFAGSIEGWGVLVCSGDIQFSGSFTFHGLVIPYSDTQIDFATTTGTPRIIGAVLMGGATGSTFEMKGNGEALYSKDAIDKAKMIQKLLYYKILSWYENYRE